ncbi:MAG TPA: hypothetical protein VLG14_10440, partial [Sphingomonas sp.]|nr:hypothetical protein [Sphingomonas sp.]
MTVVKLVRPVGNEIQVNTVVGGFSMDPTTTRLASGNYVVIWSDNGATPQDSSASVRGQLFAADGSKIGGEFLVNTVTPGPQFYGTVTSLASGGFAVTWVSQENSVRAQVFDSAGVPVGSEQTAGPLGYYDAGQPPAITELSSGAFVVAWGHGGSIMGRLFDSAGNVGPALTLATGTAFSTPTITALSNGNFAVVWTDQSGLNGDPNVGLVGQIFDPSGAAVGSRFLVNTRLDGAQYSADTSPLAGGGFVVTWTENGPNDSNTGGIRAQVFAANGSKVGPELVVSTLAPNYQSAPTVETLSWGGFIVVWEDYSRQDGDFDVPSIRLQLFDSDGSRIGDELRINTQTRHAENDPVITVLSDSKIVVTWSDTGGSGPGPTGILSRIMTLPELGTLGNDTYTGTADQDIYTGRAGDDVIYGMDGDDVLEGGAGNDAIYGGE